MIGSGAQTAAETADLETEPVREASTLKTGRGALPERRGFLLVGVLFAGFFRVSAHLSMTEPSIPGFGLRKAQAADVPLILRFIEGLAEFERLSDECVATEDALRKTLFGDRPSAEVLLAYYESIPVGFALFFHTYSTFLAKPGIYLEDLFVVPDWRGRGFGRAMLTYLAGVAVERGCGRLEWSVLDWNEDAIRFYRRLGAAPLDEWTTFRLTGEPLAELARTST